MMNTELDAAELGKILAPFWYTFIIRGLVLIGFGLFFLFAPATSWMTVSVIFGSLSLADAAFNVSKACLIGCCMEVPNKCATLSMFILSALCSASIGFVAILNPAATAVALLFILALWFIFIGVAQFWFACLMMSEAESQNACCLGFIAVVYVVAGTTFIMDLAGNIGFFILFVGLCLALFGVQMIFMGMSLKKLYGNQYTSIAEVMDV